MNKKLYPDSGVELTPFIAKNYDKLMNIGSFGKYNNFIGRAIHDIDIKPADSILDLGCGTGRNTALMLKYLGGDGKIMGVDLSQIMQKQFETRFINEKRVVFQQQRIDIPFTLDEKFDSIFISFVIHGFPHDVRTVILENAINHLKPGGSLAILDFAEFDMNEMPALHRFIFKKIECKYAFDYIEKNWKQILETKNLEVVSEHFYFLNYVRLLTAKRVK